MKMKLLLLALAALAAINSAYGQNRGVAYVDTLAVLDAMRPQPGMTVYVLGATNVNDWGDQALPFIYSSTSSNATDRFCRATATGVGRYIHDWSGDVRTFGAVPYQSRYSLVPWGYKTTNAPIGTSDFTIAIRTTLPTTYNQPFGMFELGPVPSTNQSLTAPELLSSIGLRASPDVWGITFRGTNAASGPGSTVNEGAILESTPAAIAAYAGQTINLVVTRSGTNATIYFNGTDVSPLFTLQNPAGWAKSLALGQNVLVQVGNNANTWYWPKPVTRFALWATVLNSAQAADPFAVSGKAIDFTPEITTEPSDLTDELNAASDYAQTKGGGILYMPPGVYRVDGDVKIGKQANWKGAGSSPYPSTFRQGYRPSATTIAPWFGARNKVFYADQTMSEEVCLTARVISTLGGGITSSRWLRSTISDLTINGDLCYSSEGIVLDRVAAVGIHNVGFRGLQNHEVRAFGVNSLQIFGCEGGTLGRGFDIRGCADVTIHGCFLDGPKGPALRFLANLSRVADSVFEFALNPRTAVPPMEVPVLVDTATDVFTTSGSYGHKLHTGQAIRFDPDTNSIPTNLTATTDYYAVVTGDNTFKISTIYAEEVSRLGAMYSNSFVDITDSSATNTWYVGSGPAVGMNITGDHNAFSGNQSQQNYEGAVRLEFGNGNNRFSANQFIMNGLGNSDTNIAAVVVFGSSYNTFVGNGVDDRDLGGFSQKGFVLDSDSDWNTFLGNSWNINTPYTFGDPSKQLVLDAQQSVFQWNGSSGNLYIPKGTGFTPWAVPSFANSSAVFVDDSNGRVYFHTGPGYTADYTNFNFGITFPAEGPMYWSGANGTVALVNNGTGQTIHQYITTPTTYPLYYQVNSDTSAGFDVGTFRNYGTNSSTFAALPAFTKLGELIYGGWYGTTGAEVANAAGLSFWSDAGTWSSVNRSSQANILVTPQNTITRIAAITFNAPATLTTNDTMLILATFNGTSWNSAVKRVSFGTNDSAGSGFKVLKVAN